MEDLVAEAFARAWASWRRVSRHPAPRARIVRTALNTHISRWRRRRREVAWDGRNVLDVAAPATGEQGLDAGLAAALRRLPVRQRELIALRVCAADPRRTCPVSAPCHFVRAAASPRCM